MTMPPSNRAQVRQFRPRHKRFRPRLEVLEDRTLLATALLQALGNGLGLLVSQPASSLGIAAVTPPGPRPDARLNPQGPGGASFNPADGAQIGSTPALRLSRSQADHLSLSVPATARAGDPISVTVSARDRFGNLDPRFDDQIQLTGTDENGTGLPITYRFDSGDQGAHTFTGITFTTAGAQSITATDSSEVASATAQIQTLPAAASRFALTIRPATGLGNGALTQLTAGTPYFLQVVVLDEFNNLVTDYLGQIVVTTSGASSAPFIYRFLPTDGGQHNLSVVFTGAGTQALTVSDSSNPNLSNTLTGLVVSSAQARHFEFSLPHGIVAGQSFEVAVTALDAFGNLATGYRGTLKFASTDAFATLPGNIPFTSLDQGVHTFKVTFNSGGRQSLTVTDPTDSATFSAGTIVSNPAPTLSSLSQTTAVEAGSGLTLTLNGSGFVHASTVLVSGTAVAITFISGTQLQVVVPAAALATPGSLSISVSNPTPAGGTSGSQTLTVTDESLVAAGEALNFAQDQPFAAVVATFQDTGPTDPIGDYQALIDWGDGSQSSGTITATGGGAFAVTGTHNYTQEGAPEIAVSITSSEGGQITVDGVANVVSSTLNEIITSEESIIVPPGQLVATLMDRDSSATLTRPAGAEGNGLTTIFLADYRSNPQFHANPSSRPQNANYFDVRVTGVGSDDKLTVTYHYDPSIKNPSLSYYAPSAHGYQPVQGDSTIAGSYVIDTANHTITVIYGARSTPTITHLHGTVFAVVLFDEIGSGGGAGGNRGLVHNQPTATPATVTASVVALDTLGSGGGDSGSAFSTEATFLSNNQLVLAVTPSTESQAAVGRASLSTGQSSGTADGDSNTDDPYSYWLRLLGEDLFLQWLQLSQAPAPAPNDDVTVGAPERRAAPVSEESAARTELFEESDALVTSLSLTPASDGIMLPVTLIPAAESSSAMGPQLALAATVAGFGFAEMRSLQDRQKEERAARPRPTGRSRSLSFMELPDRT